MRSDLSEDVGKWHADPLGDIRPALLASQLRDLASGRAALQLRNRKRGRPIYHATNFQPPVGKARGLVALKAFIERRHLIGQGTLGNVGPGKLTGQGMPGEQALRSVGESFAKAVEAHVIRWYQSILMREPLSGAK